MSLELETKIEAFDFEKVHKVMVALNWEYFMTNGVPSVEQLKETVRELYRTLQGMNTDEISSGGFSIKVDKFKNIYFCFVVAETW